MSDKFAVYSVTKADYRHTYVPFLLVEFWFVACFLVCNINFSIFVFDTIQSVQKLKKMDENKGHEICIALELKVRPVSHRADRLPRPSFFATPCKVFTGLAPPSLAPALSPLLPFPFLPGLEPLPLALSLLPLAAGGRERYTSRAERPLRPKSCRLLISLPSSESWPRQWIQQKTVFMNQHSRVRANRPPRSMKMKLLWS